MGFYSLKVLKLYRFLVDGNFVDLEVSLLIPYEQILKRSLVVYSRNCIYWKLKGSVKLWFIQKYNLNIPIIESTNDNNLLIY
jgi:hypothetical protein